MLCLSQVYITMFSFTVFSRCSNRFRNAIAVVVVDGGGYVVGITQAQLKIDSFSECFQSFYFPNIIRKVF